MSVYQRKLVALGYARADVFDPASDDELFRLIVWLEDMRIRHYKVEERAGLRDASDSAAWASAFNQVRINGVVTLLRRETLLNVENWPMCFVVQSF